MSLYDFLSYVIMPALSISTLLVFYRFIIGPNVMDRVVALELLISIGIATITVFSIVSDNATFLDVAMILALIAFLGTVAYSYYIEKKEKNE
ncbi:monovalent cation/H+ antiporter complex subunit F [Albibacterium bauzanense]|uniref:Multisubunit sodium/proton antiporter MrpF subunit n=1 Tax=Albibacterium bauzanense TaxID=653929 RepID=A0A4R1LWC1_9SPHI|nr:monovalent cation/H+ antiporter complex subunit F [Albibacterium bauzanense]TCK83435.1 multisubunit sodium/proton antiporter MrpF subunit [Albibacterium bauzanense]